MDLLDIFKAVSLGGFAVMFFLIPKKSLYSLLNNTPDWDSESDVTSEDEDEKEFMGEFQLPFVELPDESDETVDIYEDSYTDDEGVNRSKYTFVSNEE